MKRVLIIILLIIVGIVGFGYFQLNSAVKSGVETYGPDVLKVDVGLDSVNLSPFSGNVAFSGFSIGQPDGFGDGDLVSLGAFDMKLEPGSLLTDHIIIDSILIDSPGLDVRILDGENNFEALQKGMNLPAEEAAGEEATPITITIRKLEVRTPVVALKNEGLIDVDETVNLASFTLTDLGTDEQGLEPAEIARHVMDTLQPQITKALVQLGASKAIKDIAGDAKGKLQDGVKGLLDKADDKTDGKVGGLLGKLTGKKKDEDKDNN